MKGAIVYICYLFFLLGGVQYMHAGTTPKIFISESPSFNLVKKHQVKVKKAEAGSVLIEEADTDLEDELHSSDDFNKSDFNKVLVSDRKLTANWYLAFSSQLLYKDYSKKINFFATFYGHSNPIYLEIGVLKI